MGMKITGLDELDDFLRTSPAEWADGPVRKALTAGGKILQAAITEAAPTLKTPNSPNSDALPPGALKSDIELKVYVAKGGGTAVIQPGSFTLHVARWVEYGHHMVKGGYLRFTGAGKAAKIKRGRGKWLSQHEVPPHSFIRLAADATMEEATRVMLATFGTEMIKVANRKLRSGGAGRAA